MIQGTELARDSFRASGKGGVIINTASVAGLSAMPGSSVYGATKWAIVGFTRSLQNWRKQEPPIRVAAVCPTLVLTEGGLLSKEQDEIRLEKRRKAGKTVKPLADPGIPPSAIADAGKHTSNSAAARDLCSSFLQYYDMSLTF